MKWVHAAIVGAALCLPSGVWAAKGELTVRFEESAPKDRFVFVNTGACALSNIEATVDLSPTEGALYFDTTPAGAGVEVFQPLRTETDNVALQPEQLRDGETQFSVRIASLAPGERAVVSVDVDDTFVDSARGQTQVTANEMAGASVTVAGPASQSSGVIGQDSEATIALASCG